MAEPSVTLETLVNLASRAGAIQRELFRPRGAARRLKTDLTPVTEADRLINQLVIDEITARYPEVGVRGEEGSTAVGAPWQVIVDPVDGTLPFVWGMPISTTILALVHDGRPEAAVIYDPFCDRLLTAERGTGTRLNGELISIRDHAAAERGRQVIGVCSWPGCLPSLTKVAQRLEDSGFEIAKLCSTGYMIAAVISGEWAATMSPVSGPWETAAGDLLASEAGGRCTSLFGADQRYDAPIEGHLISDGRVHEQILDVIHRVWYDAVCEAARKAR